MPGPAMKLPGKFPGLDQLPDPVRKTVEFFFPQTEVVTPTMSILRGGPGVIKGLDPLLQDSLQRGKELAKEFNKNPADFLPDPYPLTAHPTVQEMWHLLRKAPDGRDPLKVMAGEKISSRPIANPTVNPPKGFHFGKPLPPKPTVLERKAAAVPMKRDPLVEEMTNRYRQFDNFQRKARADANRGK